MYLNTADLCMPLKFSTQRSLRDYKNYPTNFMSLFRKHLKEGPKSRPTTMFDCLILSNYPFC